MLRAKHRSTPRSERPVSALAVLGGAAVFGAVAALGSVALERPARSLWSGVAEDPAAVLRRERSVYYAGCREARAAGAAPIYRGEPGYRPEMDGDADGVACEPYRGG